MPGMVPTAGRVVPPGGARREVDLAADLAGESSECEQIVLNGAGRALQNQSPAREAQGLGAVGGNPVRVRVSPRA